MATRNRLMKELKQVLTLTLPESIISLVPVATDNLYEWAAVIHPSDDSGSLYSRGYFLLKIQIPDDYPLSPPSIKFNLRPEVSKPDDNLKLCRYLPHCNVNFKTGEICLDILKPENWSPAWTLQSAVLAIVVLLDNQEPDSPLNVDMANLFRLGDQVAIKSIINYYINNYSV